MVKQLEPLAWKRLSWHHRFGCALLHIFRRDGGGGEVAFCVPPTCPAAALGKGGDIPGLFMPSSHIPERLPLLLQLINSPAMVGFLGQSPLSAEPVRRVYVQGDSQKSCTVMPAQPRQLNSLSSRKMVCVCMHTQNVGCASCLSVNLSSEGTG